jgi:hypothetical protein
MVPATLHPKSDRLQIGPKRGTRNGANLGSMGKKLNTKLINKRIILIRRKCINPVAIQT